MERSLLAGVVALRWAAWLWMAVVLAIGADRLVRPLPAVALVGAALAATVATTVALRRDHRLLERPAAAVGEAALGATLLLADGWVFGPGHSFSDEQSLGVAWPLAGVISVGIVVGPLPGAAAGLAMGLARTVSSVVNLGPGAPLGDVQVLSLVTTGILYALAGGVTGYAARLILRAEREISAARAREEVARTLHDGVLQTLAIVERRADDPALARLARDQERELREFLFGAAGGRLVGRGSLGDDLRAAAGRFESAFGGRVDVLVPDDLPPLPPRVRDALAGAVGEALTNAGKHGAAGRVVIYVEPDDGRVFCSVKDDGHGFDPRHTDERVGLRSSIRGRIAEVGGRVEVESDPGRGAEVRLWVPA